MLPGYILVVSGGYKDSSGNLLTGTVHFQPVLSNGTPTSCRSGPSTPTTVGAYNAGTAYARGQAALWSDENVYVSVVNNNTNHAPTTTTGGNTTLNSAYWLLASAGCLGSGQTSKLPIPVTVTDGAFAVILPDVSTTYPANIGFAVTGTDSVGRPTLGTGYNCFQPTTVQGENGSADADGVVNFDIWDPNLAPQVTVQTGPAGLTAYQVAVQDGYGGTEAQWLASLQGPSGTLTGTVQQFTIQGSGTVESVLTANSLDLADADVDANGNVLRGIKTDGTNVLPIVAVSKSLQVIDRLETAIPLNGYNAVEATVDGSGNLLDHREPSGKVHQHVDFEFHGDVKVDGRFTIASPQPLARTIFELNIALGSGQSLMQAFRATVTPNGSDVLSTTQPFRNICLNPGPRGGRINTGSDIGGQNNGLIDPSTLTSFIPLIENYDIAYGQSDATLGAGETVSSGLCNQATYLLMQQGQAAVFAAAVSAEAGANYNDIKPGTNVYANALTMVSKIHSLGSSYGSVGVQALVWVHMEQDEAYATANYGADLVTIVDSYNAAVAAITGQTQYFPMLVWLSCSYGTIGNAQPVILPQVLAAAAANPTKIIVVASEYPYTHAPQDGIHLIAASQQWGGEKFGEALTSLVVNGTWTGLRVASAVLQGKTIVATFQTPYGPLVIDTSGTQVTDPGTTILAGSKYGFEFADGSGSPPAITAVTVIPGTLSVRIDLASVPTGSSPVLRAAWTATPGAYAGPTTGPRCLLRDSDPTPSINGHSNLYNWCQPFSLALS